MIGNTVPHALSVISAVIIVRLDRHGMAEIGGGALAADSEDEAVEKGLQNTKEF